MKFAPWRLAQIGTHGSDLFVFRPDGATGVFNPRMGTRSLTWFSGTSYARCDRAGHSCIWYPGSIPPLCIRARARIQVAWVDVKPVDGGPETQLLVWLKCLGG